MGSLGPWTPGLPALESGSVNLHPLMSLNNLLKLGRRGSSLSPASLAAPIRLPHRGSCAAVRVLLKFGKRPLIPLFASLPVHASATAARCCDVHPAVTRLRPARARSVGSLGSFPVLPDWERQGVSFPGTFNGELPGALLSRACYGPVPLSRSTWASRFART